MPGIELIVASQMKFPARRSWRRWNIFHSIINSLFIMLTSCPAISDMQLPSVVGGRCEYKSYKGLAEIVSVTKVGTANSMMNDEYEVKFLFHPQEKTIGKVLRDYSGPFQLVSDIGTQPTKRFLEKHEIRVGRPIECIMKLIARGTCSPLLFEFSWSDGGEKNLD